MGTHEVDGPKANPRIMEYFRTSGGDWAQDDSVPWCGAFMGWTMARAGHDLPKEPLRARSWATWGEPLAAFEPGCVVVTSRGKDPASGHVTLGVEDSGDKIMCLGGNQGDEVSIVAVWKASVIAYRRVPGVTPPAAPSKASTVATSQTIRNAGGAIVATAAVAAEDASGVAKQTVEAVKGVFGPDTSAAWLLDHAKGELKWLFLAIAASCLVGVVARRLRATEEGKIG